MKNLIKLLIVSVLFIGYSTTSNASHIAGADLEYYCVGQDSFLITLNVFRDCSGIDFPNQTATINITSSCGASITSTLALQPPVDSSSTAPGPAEVSQLCGRVIGSSACNGGVLPGMYQYLFTGIVVLSPPCSVWTIGYAPPCCRNTNINLTGSSSAYVEATLNSVVDSCNNSPVFQAQPIPYVCAGQQVQYNFGVNDVDGDSLVYSFDCGFTTSGVPNTFGLPYLCNQPLLGATIDSSNGLVKFTALLTGNYVVVVKVCEYERGTGTLKGCVMRDILFVVQSCVNQQPSPKVNISNFSGSATLIDSNSIELCVGENFKLEFKVYDPDPNDTIHYSSNFKKIFAGGKDSLYFPNAPARYDTAIIILQWKAVPTPGVFFPFFVELNDNACPVTGITYLTYDISLIEATYAGPDQTICEGTQEARLSAKGGDQFTWTALPGGDPMVVGPLGTGNFSCDTCQTTFAYPSINTCYQVVSNLSGTCKAIDTVCITVAPNFDLTVPNDTLICSIGEIELFANSDDPLQTYSYRWAPNKFINRIDIKDPVVKPDVNTTYRVTVTASGGCLKNDEVSISLSAPFPEINAISASDTIICLQDTITLKAALGELIPKRCGPSQSVCSGNSKTIQIGDTTATLSNSSTCSIWTDACWPTPFAGYYGSAKQQFLYRAQDLLAEGLTAGQLKSLSFKVSTVGPVTFYINYEIKMGCTSAKAFTGNWESGLSTVYTNPSFVTPTSGWNTFNFTNPYDWDGKSSLVVEICFDNGSPAGTPSNAVAEYETTPYVSTNFVFGNSGACTAFSMAGASPTSKLPLTKFEVCTAADPNAFTFKWLTSTGIISPYVDTDQEILAFDTLFNVFYPGPIPYEVAIADTYGVCFDTVKQNVHIVSKYDVTPNTSDFCPTSPLTYLTAFTPGGFWTDPNGAVDSTGLFNPGIGIGSYTVTYTVNDGSACTNSGSTVIDVVKPPDSSLVDYGEFCENDPSIQLVGVVPGGVFSSNSSVISNALTETGLLDATKLTLDTSNSILLTYTSESPQCKNAGEHKITFRSSDLFKIRGYDKGGYCTHDTLDLFSYSAVFDTTVSGNPPKTTIDTIFILEDSSTLVWSGPGIDPATGLFDPSSLNEGQTVTISLSTPGFCGYTDSVPIIIHNLPNTSITSSTGTDTIFCKGENVQVQFEGFPKQQSGTTELGVWRHYGQWNGQAIPAFNPANPVPKVGLHKSTYTFIDANGCIDSSSIHFEIVKAPDDMEDQEFTFCIGSSFDQLYIDTTAFDYTGTIYWYSDPTTTNVIDQGTSIGGISALTEDLKLFVKQIDDKGCQSANKATIFVNAATPPNIKYDTVSTYGVETGAGIPVEFSLINTSIGTDASLDNSRWKWTYYSLDSLLSIIDLGNDKNLNLSLAYDELYDKGALNDELTGRSAYVVKLEGYDENGCYGEYYEIFTIEAFTDFFVQNIFTPNGDGLNDEFAPKIEGMKMFDCKIYNRWGRKVYEFDLDSEKQSWDGVDKVGGDETKDGVYYYVIEYQFLRDDEPTAVKGTVTLIQ